MAKTDIESMIEWKERRGEERRASTLPYELQRLSQIWKEKSDDALHFADFMPMRIVTVVEVFVREAVRELVDTGDPYLQRAEQLAKGARFDFALLSNLQGRKVSVGDLVAHTISINEPARIIAYLDNLIPDFVPKLKASHERWVEDREKWPLKPIVRDYDAMMKGLARLFSVRHVLTHELPTERPFDPAEIDEYFAFAIEFLKAVDWVLVGELQDAVPRTQALMNASAGESMGALEAEMRAILDMVAAKGEVSPGLLYASQAAWDEFSRREADLHASLVEGGSMYPMVWASARAEEIQHRTNALRRWIDREEGDI